MAFGPLSSDVRANWPSTEFEQGTLIDAGEALVVVSFNPDQEDNVGRVAAFRQQYGLDENVRLLGGYAGSLSNSGELLQLLRPGTPSDINPARVPMVWEDETLYDDRSPWPTDWQVAGPQQRRFPG